MDQSEPSGEPQTSTAVVPSVVAVVVTHNPGPWFEDALTSVAEQDYRNLSVLVVDTGSVDDPTSRIAAVAPETFVRRLGSDPGYGAAANQALQMVEGAAFYLLCHDDVRLEPSALRLMIEEAYRSNAGVVGPKIVSWTDPNRLLQVGLGSDQFGVPSAMAERGELDQEQLDGVRDVFSVPGGCILIRADLYEALGGFDEAMTFQGEDVDLCWRAHLAGARVLVAPAARVAHVEALGERRPDDRRRLQARHRLRMVLTNYSLFYTLAILPRQWLLSLVEVLVALVTGRFRHASEVLAAYTWNARNLRSVLAKRRQVKALRQVPDLEIRRLQVRGSARFTAFARGQLGNGRTPSANLGDTGRQLVSAVRQGFGQQNAVMVLVVGVVVAFGSRHLLTQRAPVIGEFVPFPSWGPDMIREWWSGWRSVGLGVEASPPTGLGLFGLLGTLLLNSTGVLRNVLIAGMLPLGAVGAWRLGRMRMPSRAPAVAVLAYLLNPLPYNAFAAGSWRGLAVYAAAPWILRRLIVSADDGSFAPAAPLARRRLIHQVVGLGVIVALATIFYPATPLLVLLMIVGLVIGSALVWSWNGVGRLVGVGVAAAAAAVVLHFPWLIGGLAHHDPDLTFAGRTPDAGGYRLVQALHFDVGPLGASRLTWGLFIAALLPLAIGRGWRLAWAVRAWSVAGMCWLVIAAQRAGVIDVKLPPAQVLLVPAAAALALAIALGVVAFEVDLPGYRFGWRQFVTLLGAAGLVVAALPLLTSSFDGRWKMPRGGYDRALRFQAPENGGDAGPFRVLWLGDPAVLPIGAWDLPASVGRGSYATTVGLPTARNLWTGPESDAARLLPGALATARAGNTSHLGKLLAPMGVRYIVVSSQLAPVPFGGRRVPADPGLRDLLASQLDLEEVDVNPAVRVFRNTAWIPLATDLGPLSKINDPFGLDARLVGPPLRTDGFNGFAGDVPPSSTVHLSEAASPHWQLSVNGTKAAETTGFGWANRFAIDKGGKATVHYAVPLRRLGLSLAQIALWVLAVVVLLLSNPARRRGQPDGGPDARRAGAPLDEERNATVAFVTAGAAAPEDLDDRRHHGRREPAHARRRSRWRRRSEPSSAPPTVTAVNQELEDEEQIGPLAAADLEFTGEHGVEIAPEAEEVGEAPVEAEPKVEPEAVSSVPLVVEYPESEPGAGPADQAIEHTAEPESAPGAGPAEQAIEHAAEPESAPAASPSVPRPPLRSRSVRARAARSASRSSQPESTGPSAARVNGHDPDASERGLGNARERSGDEAPEDDGGVPR